MIILINLPIRSTLKKRVEYQNDYDVLTKAFIRNLRDYPDLINLHKKEHEAFGGEKYIGVDLWCVENLVDRLLEKRGFDRGDSLSAEVYDELTTEWDRLSKQYRDWLRRSLLESGIWLKYQRLYLSDRGKFRTVTGDGIGDMRDPLILLDPDCDWRVSDYQPHDFNHEVIIPEEQGIRKSDVLGFTAPFAGLERGSEYNVREVAKTLRVPYYDDKGGLIWPKKMSPEEVQQFVAEKKKENK